MAKYKVKLSPRAIRDLRDIFSYIAIENLSPDTAKKQTDRIYESLKNLEQFPDSHQERLEGRYANKGYRQLIIGSYIAIFRIDKQSKTVMVLTILYHSQNI